MSNNASFLPEDYLAQKAERRTNLVCLVLFAVVMLGVFLAFVFTNQKWSQVKRDQMTINASYQQAATEITELIALEEQKDEMLEKADLAAALVERVPRSRLLAELINRMPDRLSLLELELTSVRVKPAVKRVDPAQTTGRLTPKRAPTKEEAAEGRKKKVQAPRYNVDITLVGVAPTDLEVSRYLAELNAYALMRDVQLQYSEEKEVEGRIMRKFEIKMRLETDADVRDVDPLSLPRNIVNPMSERLEFPAPQPLGPEVMADNPDQQEGN